MDRRRLDGQRLTGYEYEGKNENWRVPLETMERLDREGRLLRTRKGGFRVKRYLDNLEVAPRNPYGSIFRPLTLKRQSGWATATQKPVALMERIISASSNPGDVVLDPFCGCATTIEAAHKPTANG